MNKLLTAGLWGACRVLVRIPLSHGRGSKWLLSVREETRIFPLVSLLITALLVYFKGN